MALLLPECTLPKKWDLPNITFSRVRGIWEQSRALQNRGDLARMRCDIMASWA